MWPVETKSQNDNLRRLLDSRKAIPECFFIVTVGDKQNF